MIKFNANDKPKAAILVLAVLGVFYVIFMRFSALTAPKPQQSAVVDLTQETGQRAQTLFASNESHAVVLDMGEPVTSVNPFRRVLADPDARFSAPAPQPAKSTPTSSFMPKSALPAPTSEMPILPAQLSTSDLQQVTQAPEFKLEGVLTGAHPVADLRVGTATHVLEDGQTLGQYTVRAITETSCKLQRGKETISLRLQ
jgi:hypothetical protein